MKTFKDQITEVLDDDDDRLFKSKTKKAKKGQPDIYSIHIDFVGKHRYSTEDKKQAYKEFEKLKKALKKGQKIWMNVEFTERGKRIKDQEIMPYIKK